MIILLNHYKITRLSFVRAFAGLHLTSLLFSRHNILVEKIVHELQANSIYALMNEFPSTSHISNAHLTRMTNILQNILLDLFMAVLRKAITTT